MVGAKGFEPSTSWSRTRRASQAALRPDDLNAAHSLPQGFLEYHRHCARARRVFCPAVYPQIEIEALQKHPAAKLAQLDGVFRPASSS